MAKTLKPKSPLKSKTLLTRGRLLALLAAALLLATAAPAMAAKCGNNSSGFERWKRSFAKEAATNGIGRRGIQALKATRYSTGTIRADRGQKSFKLSLDQFMKKRGANAIASKGKRLKKSNARLLASIEKRYGVPPGPLLAIWGLETGFGGYMGRQNTLSAVATLAYDCRRSEYFTGHLYAALQLVDRGSLNPSQRGAMHGEVGQTQFLPKSILLYGVDGDGNGRVDLNSKADALASTANFLRGHGWQRGAGYQPGQPNYRAIKGWNAAGVYQQTIAIVGRKIDGG
ncbi:MAG: lytic murein transglycosylase [Methyloceanibacter sp.]|jgi:lytic murein transglycosylase